jgi:glucose/arabinose dehydrogenase
MVKHGRGYGGLFLAALLAAQAQSACLDTEDTLHLAGTGGSGNTAGSAEPSGGNRQEGGSAGGAGESGSGGAGAPATGGAGSGATAGGGTDPGGAGLGGEAGSPPEPLAPSCARASGKVPDLKLTAVASASGPVQLASPPGDDRLFVVERGGDIVVMKRDGSSEKTFLSLDVATYYSEVGLLGLAFHPDYAENGLFYVHYIAPRVGDAHGDLVIAEYERSEDPDRAVSTARRELFRMPQPTHKHKGGSMAFDSEKLLYIGVGNAGEVSWSGDESVLSGKILRVDPAPDAASYRIPARNPKREGWLPEILETGLRNPWRIALDPCTDDLYIGDVGNTTYEEIDISPADQRGHDFGFSKLEGNVLQCDEDDEDCNDEGVTPPVAGYAHDEGCAIIGGVVYRGSNIPALRGTYFYSDLCEGLFRTFRYQDGSVKDERDITEDLNPDGIESIASFGSDAAGEVYVLSLKGNRVYRIDPE